MQQHSRDEGEIVSILSTEEQEKLTELLTKLQQKWVFDKKKMMQEK